MQASRQLPYPALIGNPSQRPWAAVVIETANFQEIRQKMRPRLNSRQAKVMIPVRIIRNIRNVGAGEERTGERAANATNKYTKKVRPIKKYFPG